MNEDGLSALKSRETYLGLGSSPGLQFLKAVSEVIQECDHRGHWHIAPGPYKIVRFCGGCGKSWWIPARDDVLSLSAGERFIQEWEEIKERMEVPPLPASFYDDPQSDEEDMDE